MLKLCYYFMAFVLLGSVSFCVDADARSVKDSPVGYAENKVLVDDIRTVSPDLPRKMTVERPYRDAIRVISEGWYGRKNTLLFQLDRNDPMVHGGKRAEVSFPSVSSAHMWEYRFSTKFPRSWEADPKSLDSFAQWHAFPDLSDGEHWRSPPLALLTKGDDIYLDRRYDTRRITLKNKPEGRELIRIAPLERAKWIPWRVQVKWTQYPVSGQPGSGLLKVWQGERLVYSYQGLLGYNDAKGPYFKFGLYKWDWNTQRNHNSSVSRRAILFKNISENRLD